MATIVGRTGTRNWDTATDWVGDAKPTSTDDVEIPSGCTMTKDTAIAAPDCAALKVDGQVTIAGTDGLKFSGLPTGSGIVSLRGTAEFWNASSAGNTMSFTFDSAGTAVGAGNGTVLQISGGNNNYLNGSASALVTGPQVFINTHFNISGHLYINSWSVEDVFTGCDWQIDGARRRRLGGVFNWDDCIFYGTGVYAFNTGITGQHTFRNCLFGYSDRALTTDPFTNLVYRDGASINMAFHNCLFNISGILLYSNGVSVPWMYELNFHGFNGNPDLWVRLQWAVEFGNGVDGSDNIWYIECVDESDAVGSIQKFGWKGAIAIPCSDGDDFSALELYVKLPTGWPAGTDNFQITIDPGNLWGLEYTEDIDTTENVYVRVDLGSSLPNVGVADNSGSEGALVIQLSLKDHTQNTVIYIKDLTF